MPTRITTLLVITTLAAACASQPRPLPSIPDGAALHLEVTSADTLAEPSASNGRTTATNMAGGTAAGIGLGAAYGAYLGVGCGPLLIICSPVMAVGGAMGGGIAGLGLGTFEAVRLAIPGEKAEALNAIIERCFVSFDFAGTLDTEFRARAGGRWRFTSAASVDLTVTVTAVELDKHPDDRISVTVVTVVDIVDRSGAEVRSEQRRFVGESAARHVDEWLEADGERFPHELEGAIARATREMIASLSGY